MNITSLSTDQLKPSPYQPRQELSKDHVKHLADSIELVGIQEPLQVTQNCTGYWIIAGHHRHAAAQLIGLNELPCLVVEGDETRLHLLASLTNDARLQEKPMEQARAYDKLLKTMSKEDLSKAIAKPITFMERRITLLRLDSGIQKLVDSGNIPITLAELIAELPDHYLQVKAVGICKGLELTAARSAVTQLLAASQNVSMFGEETSQEDKDKQIRAGKVFEERLNVLDKAIGGFTTNDLSLTAGVLVNAEKHLAYLETAGKEIKHLQGLLLEAKGIKAATGQVASAGFVAIRLKELRRARTLSVRELATGAGISYPNLSKIENGKTKPQPSTIRKLAKALSVAPTALMS